MAVRARERVLIEPDGAGAGGPVCIDRIRTERMRAGCSRARSH